MPAQQVCEEEPRGLDVRLHVEPANRSVPRQLGLLGDGDEACAFLEPVLVVVVVIVAVVVVMVVVVMVVVLVMVIVVWCGGNSDGGEGFRRIESV